MTAQFRTIGNQVSSIALKMYRLVFVVARAI